MSNFRVAKNATTSDSARVACRAAMLMIGLALVLGACGRTPSASTRTTGTLVPESATPTSVDLPFPAPTSAVAPARTPDSDDATEVAEPSTDATAVATVAPIPTAPSTPSPTSTEEPAATPEPSPTQEPESTPAATATPRPTATPEDSEPTATPEPEETPTTGTPTPTPFPVIDGVPLTEVGCDIEPGREVKVGDVVTFVATQEPAQLPLSFAFNHGNGVIDRRAVSVGRYEAPGTYPVTLQWTVFDTTGTVSCGSMIVTGVGAADFQPGDYVGLTEAEAEARASQLGLASVRIARRDDETFVGTADFRVDRLNLEIDNGIVTTASIG